MHLDCVIFLILSNIAYTKFSVGPFLKQFVDKITFDSISYGASKGEKAILDVFLSKAFLLPCVCIMNAQLSLRYDCPRQSFGF